MQKNANFKKHPTAQIRRPNLMRSQGAANPAVPSVTSYFCSNPVFEKNFAKKSSRPLRRIRGAKLRRSRDAANPAAPSVTCYFCLERKNANFKKHKAAENLAAKLGRSQGAANPAVPSVTSYFCSNPEFEKNFEKN